MPANAKTGPAGPDPLGTISASSTGAWSGRYLRQPPRGSEEGPEGALAPNLTPDDATGLGHWTRTDLVWFLQTASKPDGDDSTGLMKEVIEEGYSQLPAADLEAIAEYLASLPAIANEALREREAESDTASAVPRDR